VRKSIASNAELQAAIARESGNRAAVGFGWWCSPEMAHQLQLYRAAKKAEVAVTKRHTDLSEPPLPPGPPSTPVGDDVVADPIPESTFRLLRRLLQPHRMNLCCWVG
jgi:hypothetical protein